MAIHGPSLGIGAAISAVAIIGVLYALNGVAPDAVFKADDIKPSDAESAQIAAQEETDTVDLSVLYDNGSPILGDENAPITIIEFGDYQCFYCNRFFHDTESSIHENYIKTGKAKMIFKDYVIIGEDSVVAAHAAHCANEQGKFWEYHDTLYNHWNGENNGWASEENQYKFAQEVGLETQAFTECMTSQKYNPLIQASTNDAKRLGLTGTPAFFVIGENNKIVKVPGAQPYDVFVSVLDSPELRGN